MGQGRQQGAIIGGSAWGGVTGGTEAGARGGGACLGSSEGSVRGRACRGGEEGEARSAVLYWGSLTVPRAEAAGTRGRGVPRDGAWHWGVRAPNTVSTPPIGSARALSSGASHPAPRPWVELGSTQGVVWCGVVWCGVVWCGVVWCAEGAVTRRQRPGCLPTGTGKRAGLCVLCAHRVYVCRSWRGEGGAGKTCSAPPWRPSLLQKLPVHSLSLRLLVQA